MQIVHHRTTSQVEQVLARPTVTGAVALPVPDVRQVVLDSDTFAQSGAPFMAALTNAQFLQQLLFGVHTDAASAFAPRAARPLRTYRTGLGREMHGFAGLTTHLDSLRTTQQLSFPVHHEGCFGKESACPHRP